MSKNNAKLQVQQNSYDQLLEKLNSFWVANRITIYAAVIVLIAAVVLYATVKDRQATANTAAQNAFGIAIASYLNDSAQLSTALQNITTEHSGTEYSTYAAFMLAEQKLTVSNFEDALVWFETALANNKANSFVYAEAYEGKGVALEGLNRIEEAKSTYQKVLSLKEGEHRYAQVNLKLALLAKADSNNDEALAYFQAIANNRDAPAETKSIALNEIEVLR